jgi:alpha-tubulin suppressor-like RCC1 family protein
VRIAALVVLSACRYGFNDVPASGDATTSPDVAADGAVPLVSPRVVSANNAGACAVLDDGSLWCWGDNINHAFGDSDPGIISPTRVAPTLDWIDVAAGPDHSCGRTLDGALWCWGNGSIGQLGTGGTTASATPVQVGTALDWTAIAVNYSGGCGLRGAGDLYCWGANQYGDVGDGTTATQDAPVPVMAGTTFATIATFAYHACAITTGGALYCWGSGYYGELGTGSTASSNPTPAPVAGTWRAVTIGDWVTCGIRTDGTAWCWGLYLGTAQNQIGSFTDWTSIVVGDDFEVNASHMCGLRGTDLWCAGNPKKGAFGNGDDTTDAAYATPVQVDAGHTFKLLTASESSMCAARDGQVACTGLGASGQLGDGSTRVAFTPRALAGTWSHVDAGYSFATAIASDGSLWAWGDDSDGQVPTQRFHNTLAPIQVGTSGTAWQQVRAANIGALQIRSDSTLWRTGAQYSSTGGWSNYITPFQMGTAAWTAIDEGWWHDCGIQSDQSLWCWGANSVGEVGNGATTSSPTPVHIDSNKTYTAISAGMEASCGIRTGGALYCWGTNVGDGTTVAKTAPTLVSAGPWAAVSVGSNRSCGLQTDSSLWCWGQGTGDGTQNSPLAPEHIGTATWTQVSAGATHTCGIQVDHSLWCWGSNNYGQLGDGTRIDATVPVRVGTGTTWNEVAAGNGFTCALTQTGTLSCWGTSHDGELGDGLAWTKTFQTIQGTSL